jgi:ribonuclease HII
MSVENRLSFEQELWPKYQLVCGLDEVGRGCLYGPVCVAAVIWPCNSTLSELPKVRDSKKLTMKQRETLYDQIMKSAVAVHVTYASAQEIDRINILQATLKCMTTALEELRPRPHYCLVDGNIMPNTSVPGRTIVKGDDRSLSIAAASIIAKVSRDRLMIEAVRLNPSLAVYGIDHNMGYGSLDHRKALTMHGNTPDHRQSFKWKPVEGLNCPVQVSNGTIEGLNCPSTSESRDNCLSTN